MSEAVTPPAGEAPAGTGTGEAPATATTGTEAPPANAAGTGTGEAPKPNAAAGTGSDDDPANWDPERASATIRAQRERENTLEQQLKDERAKVAEFERAKLTDAERKDADLKAAQKRADDLAKQNAELKRDGAFRTAATTAGLKPEAMPAALALVDLQVDDTGQPTNLADAIRQLQTDHGYLFGAATKQPPREGTTNPGAGSGGNEGGEVTLTAEQLEWARRANMTPEQYAKQLDTD